ncbi:hypothetical protein D3C78_1783710 [compost metagenome]
MRNGVEASTGKALTRPVARASASRVRRLNEREWDMGTSLIVLSGTQRGRNWGRWMGFVRCSGWLKLTI